MKLVLKVLLATVFFVFSAQAETLLENGPCEKNLELNPASLNKASLNKDELFNKLVRKLSFPKSVAIRMIENKEPAITSVAQDQDIEEIEFRVKDNARPYHEQRCPRLQGLHAITMYRGLAFKNIEEFNPRLDSKNNLIWMSPEFHVAYEYAAGDYKPHKYRYSIDTIGIIIEYRLPRSLVLWKDKEHLDMFKEKIFDGYTEAFVLAQQVSNLESYIYKVHYVKNGLKGKYLKPNDKRWILKSELY